MPRTSRQFLSDSRRRVSGRCSRGHARVQERVLSADVNPAKAQARIGFDTAGATAFEIKPCGYQRGSERCEDDQIAKAIVEYRLINDQCRSEKMLFNSGFEAPRTFRTKVPIPNECRVMREILQEARLGNSSACACFQPCRRSENKRRRKPGCGFRVEDRIVL